MRRNLSSTLGSNCQLTRCPLTRIRVTEGNVRCNLSTLLNCPLQDIAHRFGSLTNEFFERGVDPAELSSPARLEGVMDL